MSRKAIQRETTALRRYIERRIDRSVSEESLAVALITVSGEFADLAPADFDRANPDIYGDDWL